MLCWTIGTLLSIASAAIADPIDDAQAARGRRDSAAAYAIIQPLAEQGNAEAQAILAGMYNGQEVPGQPEDGYELAIHWMTKAAEQGGAEYQTRLGSWLMDGFSGRSDPKRAIPWLEKAAAQDDAVAEYLLGRAFNEGLGVPESPAEAARWFQKAVDHGNRGAEEDLAELLEMGRGLPQDDQQAFKLYLDRAQHGSATSAEAVAGFYMNGRGVKQDRVEAYAWYTVFAVLSDAADVAKVGPRNAMAETLSLREIAEGQRRALELYRPNDGRDFLSEAEAGATGDNVIRRTNAGDGFLAGSYLPQNFQKAFAIFQRLADEGYPPGLIRLARMYEAGLGVEPDLVEAYMLYYVARERSVLDDDRHDAEAGLLGLKSKMSEDLMDYARKRAWKWKPASL